MEWFTFFWTMNAMLAWFSSKDGWMNFFEPSMPCMDDFHPYMEWFNFFWTINAMLAWFSSSDGWMNFFGTINAL
jgi:hypothetical protein